MQKLLLVCCHSENRATSQIWKVLPNMVFPPNWGEKNGVVLSMRMQVILDSSFARPGWAPIWGGKKEEFRDWTIDWWDQARWRNLHKFDMSKMNASEDVFVYREFMLLWTKPQRIDHPLTVLRKIAPDKCLNLPENKHRKESKNLSGGYDCLL